MSLKNSMAGTVSPCPFPCPSPTDYVTIDSDITKKVFLLWKYGNHIAAKIPTNVRQTLLKYYQSVKT